MVTAHLERVARELAERIAALLLDAHLNEPDSCFCGTAANDLMESGLLAAALAACAREEAQFWAEEGGHVADGSSECIYCARLAERAVGEKAT